MDDEKLAFALRVLHPTKIRILESARDGRNTFTDFMKIVSKAPLSAHLRFLVEGGFLVKTGEKKNVKYKITEKGKALLEFAEMFQEQYDDFVGSKK